MATEQAATALDVATYRNRKYIGAYMAVLGRVDGIVFTAGIGENDDIVRAGPAQDLGGLRRASGCGEKQRSLKEARCISTPDSSVRFSSSPPMKSWPSPARSPTSCADKSLHVGFTLKKPLPGLPGKETFLFGLRLHCFGYGDTNFLVIP